MQTCVNGETGREYNDIQVEVKKRKENLKAEGTQRYMKSKY